MTKNPKHTLRVGLLLAAGAALTACGGSSGSDSSGDSSTRYDATALMSDTANNVILATYSDLSTEAAALETAVDTLAGNINETNLQAARDAWIATRDPWERSEAFLYGPVDTQGYDPRLDSWPVNDADLANVLDNNDAGDFTDAFIDTLDNNVRGFHTVEYLLWNNGSDTGRSSLADVVTALNNNADRVAYLQAVTRDVAATAEALHQAWAPASGDYVDTLATGGESGNTVYQSQRAAVQEIIQGMIIIVDEVGSGKIGDPFSQSDANIVESKYSYNSREDFMDDIRGVQSVYLGEYDGATGTGVSDYVLAVGDGTLDNRVRSEIQGAIDAIGEIDQPFRDAIAGTNAQQQEVQNAIDALVQLRQTLQQEVVPLLDATDFAN